MLLAVIERHSGPVHMRDYHDAHTERLKLLCERKSKGLSMPKPERLPAGVTKEANIRTVLNQMVGQNSTLATTTPAEH